MESIIVAVVLLAVLGLSAWYVIKAKKRGEKCIGCPYAKQCAKNHGSACGGQ